MDHHTIPVVEDTCAIYEKCQSALPVEKIQFKNVLVVRLIIIIVIERVS